jgi:hypothetical protein
VPIDNTHRGAGYRRVTGLRAQLTADQQSAVIKVDLRLLNMDLSDPEEIAADKAELQAEARAHPRRSTLLDRLLAGSPVVVELTALRGRLPADSPPWMHEGQGHVRVYADDVVEPADGPADQCAW